jgi:hypothetical protein
MIGNARRSVLVLAARRSDRELHVWVRVLVLMRRLMKFVHTLGACGLLGAMACLLVLIGFMPPPQSIAAHALMSAAMAGIARWVFLPSLLLTLVAGLLAMAVNRGFHNAGWAWAKLATGVLLFEWSLAAVEGPMQEEAEIGARALAGEVDSATLAGSLASQQSSLWVLLAVAVANVILGVWRPRFSRLWD